LFENVVSLQECGECRVSLVFYINRHRWIFYNQYLGKIEKFLGGDEVVKEFSGIDQVREIKDLGPYIRYLIQDGANDEVAFEELNASMFFDTDE
jgi:hypothetical protein